MKFKILMFGLCCLMSGCGLGKRSAVEQGKAVEQNAGTVFLTNLKTNANQKIQSYQTSEQYLVLGVVDSRTVPEVIRNLPSESEIGTLGLEFESEIYASQYEGEVKPVFKRQQHETKTTVFILKRKTDPDHIYLVVKNDESANQIKVKEVPITVHSSPKEYCYRARFFIRQLVDKIAVLDQEALCNPSGICNIKIRHDWPSAHDIDGTYNLNTRPVQVANQCLETQLYYGVEEVKMNRSIPRVATVLVSDDISRTGLKLTFDL